MNPAPRRLPTGLLAIIGASWLATMALLTAYQLKGDPGPEEVGWPARSEVARIPGRPALVLAAHPRCTCSRGGLRSLTHVLGRAQAYVLCVVPPELEDRQARALLKDVEKAAPGAVAVLDRGGVEARRFGCATSGQLLYFDAEGRRRPAVPAPGCPLP